MSLGAGDTGSSGLLDFEGVGALGFAALGSSSGFGGCPLLSFLGVNCTHPFSELGGSSDSGAGFDISTSSSFSGFSFMVWVVWMFLWGQAFAKWLICLQFQQCGRLPSTTTVICLWLVCYGIWDGLEVLPSQTNPNT